VSGGPFPLGHRRFRAGMVIKYKDKTHFGNNVVNFLS